MRRHSPPLLFLFIVLSIYSALHYYLWARLIHATSQPPLLHTAETAVLVALALLPLVFGILPIGFHAEPPAFLKKLGLLWLGSYFVLAGAVGVADLVAWLCRALHVLPWAGFPDGLAINGALLGLSAIGLALWGGLRTPPVREVRLSSEGLPPALAGLTVVQLSDVHIGPTLGAEFLTKIVARVNALNPDLVAITGDLVDAGVDEISNLMLPLRGLHPRLGVVYVPGNHEYYHGGAAWFAYLESLGLHVLRNQGLVFGPPDKPVYVAGVDDPTSRHAGGAGLDLAAALRERPEGMATLLLSHQPLGFEAAAERGVQLQLSGHTHGGQIFPFSLLVGLRYRFVAGLYQRGLSYLYVSKGTGFWGPPMRLGAASEITRLSFA